MSGILSRLVYALGFGLFAFACGASTCYFYVNKSWAEKLEKQSQALAKAEEEKNRHTDTIVTKYVDRIKTIEVPVYVAPSNFPDLPASFRMWYDSAASGVLPSSSGASDGAAVPLADLAATDKANLTGCRKNIEQLEALQDWAVEVSK